MTQTADAIVSRIADIVVTDENDHWVMIVEVKSRLGNADYSKQQLSVIVNSSPASVRYGLLVTTEESTFFRRDKNGLEGVALLKVPTAEVLQEYDPQFKAGRAYEFYMVGLVEAWLRDIAYRWKNVAPPFYRELAQVGIAQALDNGTTLSEVRL